MNKIAIAFLATASLAAFGCKKKPGGDAAEAQAYVDAVCACKDQACVDNAKANFKGTMPADNKDLSEKLAGCQKAAAGGGAAGGGMAGGAAGGAGGAAGGAAPAGGTPPAGGDTAAAPAGGTPPAGGAGEPAPAGGTPPAGGTAPAGGETPAAGSGK